MDIAPTTFIKSAAQTAQYFGFQEADTLKHNPASQEAINKPTYTTTAQARRSDALHGLLTGGLEAVTAAKLHEYREPLLFYRLEQVPRTGEAALSLHIFNVNQSIAEAILIQASRALVSDLGFQNHRVRINSLGDRESSSRYVRELTTYLRKRLEEMPEAARELMKEHTLTALTHLIEKEHDLAYRSPNPLEYLSDQSRKHFREIVEFLDMASVNYEIDPKLIGHHECYSDALFTVDLLNDEQTPLTTAPLYIRGGRYDEFVARTTNASSSAAGAVIVLRDKKAPARVPRVSDQVPSLYVVQLGFGPKIKALILIDELRRSGVRVFQDLANNSLSAQLRDAEEKGVRHVVIMGQKEFVEDSAIVRDMTARSQETMKLDALIQKFKRSVSRRATAV